MFAAELTKKFQAATFLALLPTKLIVVAVSVRSTPFFLSQITISSVPLSVLSSWAENWISYTPAFSVLI